MAKIPKQSSLIRCPFSKHEGVEWETVLSEDRSYIEWLVSHEGPAMSKYLYEHLMDLLEEDE